MKIYHLEDMTKGWFVGTFTPTAYYCKEAEVAVKQYEKGEYELSHIHNIATELTVIVDGIVSMNGIEYHSGQIIVIDPGESTDFKAITDTITVVVKIPSVIGDKYSGV